MTENPNVENSCKKGIKSNEMKSKNGEQFTSINFDIYS